MKRRIDDSPVDGLLVTFEDAFYFDTWDEAFQFIYKVDQLSHNPESKITLEVKL